MIKLNSKACVGCSACEAVCPVRAIKMSSNDRGFLYPEISVEKCIDCGMCEMVCLCEKKEINSDERLKLPQYFIAAHNNPDEHRKSQSGGVSYAIGRVIIDSGGIVYGCLINEQNEVVHCRCSTKEELKKTRGSKYVQSKIGATYSEALDDLKSGKIVLFTGTSCQIEGLYLYLKAKRCSIDNLYTADLICHGVPSPRILKDYVSFIEEKYNEKVVDIDLRSRQYAPERKVVFSLLNGRKIVDEGYAELFYSNMILRESCGICRYCKVDKPADITMSDIIGIDEKYKDSLDLKLLPSMAIVHSKKGHQLIKKAELNLKQIHNSEFSQPNLKYPTEFSVQKEKFWKDYTEKGFEYVLKRYTSVGGVSTKIRRKILRAFNKW